MAVPKDPYDSQNLKLPWSDQFKVQRAGDINKLGVTRDEPGARVHPSGRVTFNTAASEILERMINAKFAGPGACGFLWAANVKKKEIAGAPFPPNVNHVTPVRVYKKTGAITGYLHWVFEDNPELVPTSARWVCVTYHPDPDKGDYIQIHLNLALRRNKATRSSKQQQQPENGKQQGPAAGESK